MNKKELLDKIQENIKSYCDAYFNFSFNPKKPVVRLHEPTIHSEEINAALNTMLSTFTTMGKKVRNFEMQYANYINTKYGVMSNSGSSANLLAIAALTNPCTPNCLKPGDEVIVPALAWSTTIWPIIQHQLIPRFVDCSLSNLNIDMNKLEKAISPQTRAIKVVHVYGNPCDMRAIMTLARKHKLFVIEDSCEAMGATYEDKFVGTFGHIGTFSFFYSHHISTMEGGISVTNDFDLAETMRILRAHGWSREADEHEKYVNEYPNIDPRFIFINLGYNLRPTEVNAAIGLHQLPKLHNMIKKRRETATWFLNYLSKYENLFHFPNETHNSKHAWFGFPIILKEKAPFTVKALTNHLNQNYIETRPIIAGNIVRHPALKMYKYTVASDLSNADIIMRRGFAIGCHHLINQSARKYVVNVIDAFIEKFYNKKSFHK